MLQSKISRILFQEKPKYMKTKSLSVGAKVSIRIMIIAHILAICFISAVFFIFNTKKIEYYIGILILFIPMAIAWIITIWRIDRRFPGVWNRHILKNNSN